MLAKISAGLIIIGFMFVGAQSLEEQRADLQDKVDELKNKIKDEKLYFAKYQKDKEEIISQKTRELEAVTRENESYTREITALENDIKNNELSIKTIDKRNEKVNNQIKNICEELKAQLDRIPYDLDKRKAQLSSIIMDIESEKASAMESFVRLMKFLNSEEMIAYDSQVYEKEVKVKGEYKNVQVLRIGRVFFAADTGAEVYIYRKNTDGDFLLDEKTSLSVFQKQAVRLAVKVIQGKKPPQIVKLPFACEQIKQEGGRK